MSNEFEFPIAAFHHATEAYLVPDTLKTMYGKSPLKSPWATAHDDPGSPPALALFARHGRYKREAFRASEFAPRILAEHGFKIAMKVWLSLDSSSISDIPFWEHLVRSPRDGFAFPPLGGAASTLLRTATTHFSLSRHVHPCWRAWSGPPYRLRERRSGLVPFRPCRIETHFRIFYVASSRLRCW